MIMQAIRNEHPARVRFTCSASIGSGLPGRLDAGQQDGPGSRPSRKRAAAAPRRGPPRGRLPGGAEGDPQGLLAALQASPFRSRRVRADRDSGPVPIVPVAVIGAEESAPIFAHFKLLQKLSGLIYFPAHPFVPAFRPARAVDVPALEVQDPFHGADRHGRIPGRDDRRSGRDPGDQRTDQGPASSISWKRCSTRANRSGPVDATQSGSFQAVRGIRVTAFALLVATAAIAGCGSSTHENEPRPPVPTVVSISVGRTRSTPRRPSAAESASRGPASRTSTRTGPPPEPGRSQGPGRRELRDREPDRPGHSSSHGRGQPDRGLTPGGSGSFMMALPTGIYRFSSPASSDTALLNVGPSRVSSGGICSFPDLTAVGPVCAGPPIETRRPTEAKNGWDGSLNTARVGTIRRNFHVPPETPERNEGVCRPR